MLISYTQLEDICESIRINVLTGDFKFTSDDFIIFDHFIQNPIYRQHLVPIVRILETLDNKPTHNAYVQRILPHLLHSNAPSARYAALDLITSRDEPQYSELLSIAKIILKNEQSAYIKEYLDTL